MPESSMQDQLQFRLAALVAMLLLLPAVIDAADPGLEVEATTLDERGVITHRIRSPHQSGTIPIRVLVPRDLRSGEKIPVLYLLPVEKGLESSYGDGVQEVLKHDLHNRHRLVCVAPSFSHLPWYADHPGDEGIQQESYLLKDVIPFVEKFYPVRRQSRHRHLVGYSKSGWGAFTLILRHPHQFGRAAAWDAPMMMDKPGDYGSGPIFSGEENFRHYQVTRLIEQADRSFTRQSRLVLTGYFGNFRQHHVALHELMEKQGVLHQYRDGPKRKHDWHSGWLAEALELMFE
jgi:S-formylglutathione hydrolase FrmB